jgi:hypothetical protein
MCCLPHQETADHQLLTDLAASASLTSSSTGGSSISIPGLARADMVMEKERHKDKTIYEGTWPSSSSSSSSNSGSSGGSTLIKVSLSRLFDTTHRRRGIEVAGTSPQLQGLLQQLLQDRSLEGAQLQQLRQHLGNLLEFAEAATSHMAEA